VHCRPKNDVGLHQLVNCRIDEGHRKRRAVGADNYDGVRPGRQFRGKESLHSCAEIAFTLWTEVELSTREVRKVGTRLVGSKRDDPSCRPHYFAKSVERVAQEGVGDLSCAICAHDSRQSCLHEAGTWPLGEDTEDSAHVTPRTTRRADGRSAASTSRAA